MRKKKLLIIALVVVSVVWAIALYLHVQAYSEATRKGIDALLYVGPFSISVIVILASWITLAWKQFRHQNDLKRRENRAEKWKGQAEFSTLVKMSPKTLLIFFSLLFVSGVLIRIFISPILWPDVPEIVVPLRIILSSAMVFLILSEIYYLKVYASPKQIRVFWIVSLGLSIGFPFSIVGDLLFKALFGHSPDVLFPLLYFIGVAIGAVIGNWVGKKRYTGW